DALVLDRTEDDITVALRRDPLLSLSRLRAAGTSLGIERVFSSGPAFRAAKPSRSRDREFFAWSAAIFGDDSPRADAEIIACAIEALRDLGLTPDSIKVRISHRGAVQQLLRSRGVEQDQLPVWLALLDRVGRISNDDFTAQADRLGMP